MLPIKAKLKSGNIEDGFTLVEVLVSVFIFAVALNASMAVLVKNGNDANFLKNSHIANGLTQEGVEIVRNFRDNEWSAGSAWGSVVQDGTWSVQWDSLTLGPNADVALKKDSNGFYNYTGGIDTPFKRRIVISTPNAGIEKKIVVTVSWTERENPKTIVVEEHLFNWK